MSYQHPIMEDPPSLLVDYHSPWSDPQSPLISEEPPKLPLNAGNGPVVLAATYHYSTRVWHSQPSWCGGPLRAGICGSFRTPAVLQCGSFQHNQLTTQDTRRAQHRCSGPEEAPFERLGRKRRHCDRGREDWDKFFAVSGGRTLPQGYCPSPVPSFDRLLGAAPLLARNQKPPTDAGAYSGLRAIASSTFSGLSGSDVIGDPIAS